MSDTVPVPPSRSTSAIVTILLATMFAAGLLLVYFVHPNRASQQDTRAVADAGEASPTQTRNTAAVVADLADTTATLRAQLTATQRRVETLETDLATLQRAQIAELETERQRLEGELTALTRAEEQDGDTDAALLERDLEQLGAQPTQNGARISLTERDLRFTPGAATLASESPTSLEQVAALLVRHGDMSVLLRGHTDSSGDRATNFLLSRQRAIAVRDLLIGLGLAQARIDVEGVGDADPIADNDTPEGRARNRRVEVFLTR